ncbi:MAG: GGDEF domain-containing protein [Acidimicrobiia bacterium]|nr:GGDEF domain-containing protein [Acidimicrobiia bacterium]MDH5236972.1 GGDEF domain-containing protein [Acidimicrobiia bacterium]
MKESRRRRLIAGWVLVAALVLAAVGTIRQVVIHTTARGESASRLMAADQAQAALRIDVLADSVLNLRPELRDEDSLAEVIEDVGDEAGLIEDALVEVEIAPNLYTSISGAAAQAIEMAEGRDPGATPMAEVLALHHQLLTDAGRLLDSAKFVDPDLALARASFAGHFELTARSLAGEAVDGDEYERSSAAATAAAETLREDHDPQLFEPDVDLVWAGELDGTSFDHLSELLASVDSAIAVEITHAHPRPEPTAIWAWVAVTAGLAVLGAIAGAHAWHGRSSRERELRHHLRHDSLTGLLTRAQLAPAFADAHNDSEAPVGVLYMDLDGFKSVNDTYGHHIGDLLLMEVADRLRADVKPRDRALRLGGDEFAILVSDLSSPHEAVAIGQRLVHTMSQPFVLEEQLVEVGASVGVAVSSAPSDDIETLLRHADAALYAAKEAGRGRVVAAWSLHDRPDLAPAVSARQMGQVVI